MKKAVSLFLLLSLCLLLAVPALAEGELKVQLSPQKLVVDGQDIKCEKYNINGSNYFKLRDIAMLLRGTPACFDISFDKESKKVFVMKGGEYESVGTELQRGEDQSGSCVPSVWTLWVDGVQAEVSTYNIGGANFYKLRDMGDVLGYVVDYDPDSNTSFVYTDIIHTAVTTLKEPFAEVMGWSFSAPAERRPRITFYSGGYGSEIVEGQIKASAPVITRSVEDVDLVTYTVRYEENGRCLLSGVTERNRNGIGSNGSSYTFYDYYTGVIFRSRNLGSNDFYADQMLVSYRGKTYPISYRLNVRDEGYYTVDGTDIEDTLHCYFSFSITVPKDYDGLVLGMECKDPVYVNEARPEGWAADFTEAHYWNGADSMENWVFIRVADWAVDVE